MSKVEFNAILKNYELEYWLSHKNEEYTRPSVMKKLFQNEIIVGSVAADIGSGPHCGVFNELLFEKMYVVDPLWYRYKTLGLDRLVSNVVCVEAMAEDFKLPEKADVIFSFNALDHSGSLESSFNNIMDNLNEEGKFYFHVHLRTEKQLNAGHRMVLTEDLIDNILKPYNILNKKIVDKCPLDNKYYKSYIAIIGGK